MKRLFFSSIYLLVPALFLSIESQAQWEQLYPNNIPVQSIVSIGTNIFAGFNGYSSNYGGIIRSTDNGNTWFTVDSGLVENDNDTLNVLHLAVIGNTIIAGTDSEGIFISSDNGNSWKQSNKGMADSANQILTITAMDTNNSKIYASAYWAGVFVSSDTGKSWKEIDNGFRLNYFGKPADRINAFGFIGGNIYAFSYFGMYFSTNDGSNWMVDSSIQKSKSYATLDGVMYLGEANVILRSTDKGISWTYLNFPKDTIAGDLNIECLIGYKKKLIAGTDHGVYFSIDSGVTWNSFNLGWKKYNSGVAYSFAINNNYLFAGSYGVWRIPLSQLLTSVENPNQNIIDRYYLGQNYPNPFNPATTISYSIPNASFVTIKVYDVLGREISTLINKNELTGKHFVDFDASNLASGVYFYQLKVVHTINHTWDFIQTKKMRFLK